MAPGSNVTFVEKKGVEYNAIVVTDFGDKAEIMWASPDANQRFRGKQGVYPFFKEGMTEKYIQVPTLVEPGTAKAPESTPQTGVPGPIDTFKDAKSTDASSDIGKQEEDNIDGMGPLQKGVQETLADAKAKADE